MKVPKRPASLADCRAELAKVEKRLRQDQDRREFLVATLGSYDAGKPIPKQGSRWTKTEDLGGIGGRKLMHSTEYTFVCYGHGEAQPMMVFEGKQEDGRPYFTMVNLETFFRFFDPTPEKRRRTMSPKTRDHKRRRP